MKLIIMLLSLVCCATNGAESSLSRIKLPAHFSISVYAPNVPGARSMTFGKNGVLFVGTRDKGNVYAITPEKEVITLAHGLNMPNGVAYKNGSLYVAEVERVIKFENIDGSLRKPPKAVVVNGSFPKDKSHGWKFIRFSPDGWLYVPVGAPCNICEPKDECYASLMRMKPDGSKLEVFAKGIRNTVGFDWHPATKDLWFTDNGRDYLGDDQPDDELNRAPRAGLHFGFPYCHAGQVKDPEYGNKRPCHEFEAPVARLGAHVASLGMRFYTGKLFPESYRNRIFIAEHGSWNRTTPVGYRVISAVLSADGKNVEKLESFAEGWLRGSKVSGRPVDVEIAPDGSLLISDDEQGMIYQVSYSPSQEPK